MRNNKGFSLVELIVVIAIMAVLASVAVIGVSVYVPKAQKAADQQAINDVIDAFELYYYSNPDGVTGGYVVLDKNGVVRTDEAGFGAGAMEATFGAGWEDAIKLQYADWQGMSSPESYGDSSYLNKEDELLSTVDNLTSALGKYIEFSDGTPDDIVGEGFEDILNEYQISANDGKGIGNAAVLYVAQGTKENENAIKEAFEAGLQLTPPYTGTELMLHMYDQMAERGVESAVAMAAIYAYAEGFAQSNGQTELFHEGTKFDDVASKDDVLNQMGECFNSMAANAEPGEWEDYITGQGKKDLQGYIDMMDTVNKNKDIVTGNLSNENCFTDGTVENLLKGHAAMSNMSVGSTLDGQVAIVLAVDEDGNVLTHVAPLNWDK